MRIHYNGGLYEEPQLIALLSMISWEADVFLSSHIAFTHTSPLQHIKKSRPDCMK